MLIDLHNHTWPRSHDSVLDPLDLIARAREAGLDAICLTEHDAVWPPEEVDKLCEETGFLVIPGVEISTDDGHILAFGVEKYVFGMHRAQKLADHVQERGGAMVGAHPYRRLMPWRDDDDEWRRALERASGNPGYAQCVALESLNGRGTDQQNRFSAELCALMELPGTGGTDSHAVHDVGAVATYFESDNIHDWRDLVRELQSGRYHAVDLRTQQELPDDPPDPAAQPR